MKTKILLLLISLFFWFFSAVRVIGQTIGIGHITAEVLESVSASSSASTNFDLIRQNSGNIGNEALMTENISLGSIIINSGFGVTCNLTIKPAILVDNKGNDFSLEPVTRFSSKQDSQRVDGSQTIELAGKAMLDPNQASGLYAGSYTLVFAYN